MEIIRERFFFARQMAAFTADLSFCFCHQFTAGVTINAEQAARLVNIRGKLVEFKAVGPGRSALSRVGCPVVPVKVMLEAAIIVSADKVAVMTMETLFIPR